MYKNNYNILKICSWNLNIFKEPWSYTKIRWCWARGPLWLRLVAAAIHPKKCIVTRQKKAKQSATFSWPRKKNRATTDKKEMRRVENWLRPASMSATAVVVITTRSTQTLCLGGPKKPLNCATFGFAVRRFFILSHHRSGPFSGQKSCRNHKLEKKKKSHQKRWVKWWILLPSFAWNGWWSKCNYTFTSCTNLAELTQQMVCSRNCRRKWMAPVSGSSALIVKRTFFFVVAEGWAGREVEVTALHRSDRIRA